MINRPTLYVHNPGKPNITYFLHTVGDKDVDKIFEPLIEEVKVHGYDCQRVVIFSNRDNVVEIFSSWT